MPSPSQRLAFIDLSRSFAIALALFSHAITQFSNRNEFESTQFFAIKLFTRAAMPTFMVLFGVMIELVYMRKLETSSPTKVRNRLFLRSSMCYFGYLAIIAAALLSGYINFPKAIRGMFFLENIRNGNALKYYSVALILTWFVLLLRKRFGLCAPVLLTIVVWTITPFLSHISTPSPTSSLGKLSGFLIGVPAEGSSIYVAQSIWFVTAGILLGYSLRATTTHGILLPFVKMTLWIGSFCTIIMVGFCFTMEPADLLLGVTGKFRMSNSIAYYAWGTIQALVIMWICMFCIGIRPTNNQWSYQFSVFGRNSLLAFCFGNVALNLLPSLSLKLPIAMAVSSIFLLIFAFILIAFEMYNSRRIHLNSKHPVST